MPAIRLHDTRSGALQELRPRADGTVGIYACGPTVYNRIHVGNARPFVTYLLLARFLRHEGLGPVVVYNVTDVNDKIYERARALGVPSDDLAREMTAAYVADTDGLGLGRPDFEPTATGTMDAIVAIIARLLDAGHAYAADGDVYFRVRSDLAYGSLSHRPLDRMDQGEGADPAEPSRKEDPLDFALWKGAKPGEDTSWAAPWGAGRPGWHIECSAMAEELLGVGFEVHGGGSDLVFPHHENEAAQTRGAHGGAELARTWMHVGMLQVGEAKMAKSVGNITSLADALARWGRDALVLFFSTGHYRQPLAYTDDALAQAQRSVARLRELGRRLVEGPSPPELAGHRDRFFAELADDFATPRAWAELWDWVRAANAAADRGEEVGRSDLAEMLGVLGLEDVLAAATAEGPDADAEDLLRRRQDARAARDWAEADRLRDELAARGWQVRDGADGATLVPR